MLPCRSPIWRSTMEVFLHCIFTLELRWCASENIYIWHLSGCDDYRPGNHSNCNYMDGQVSCRQQRLPRNLKGGSASQSVSPIRIWFASILFLMGADGFLLLVDARTQSVQLELAPKQHQDCPLTLQHLSSMELAYKVWTLNTHHKFTTANLIDNHQQYELQLMYNLGTFLHCARRWKNRWGWPA